MADVQVVGATMAALALWMLLFEAGRLARPRRVRLAPGNPGRVRRRPGTIPPTRPLGTGLAPR
jgi:hypothetical protein